MKTTVDFPDELLHRAKVVAAQRRRTLRELAARGLDSVTSGMSDEGAEKEKKRNLKLLLKAMRGNFSDTHIKP